MTSPHVAGAAALLSDRHPQWTVQQIKSALVLTGDPIYADVGNTVELPLTREGGGMIDLPEADNPQVFAAPTSLSFVLRRPGTTATKTVTLADAGGGGGAWSVNVDRLSVGPDVTLSVPRTISVPGDLSLGVAAGAGAGNAETTGFVVLTRAGVTRRIPFWLRVDAPQLGREPHRTLARTGTYRGNTRGKASLVDTYRYPDDPSALGVRRVLAGPEQVFRFRLTKRVANFGVAVTGKAAGVALEPRIVFAGDENRLAGYGALPVNLNP